MAYKNSMPLISRIDQSVRDNDFIPINELKTFDNKLLEIVKMFESSQNTDSTNAMSIAKRIKDIEYHLCDALEFNSEGNIIGYINDRSVTDKDVPKNGENSIYEMLKRLDEYYGEFVKLMGSDPNIDNWKIDLDKYYNTEIAALKNKLIGIFSNTALAITLEAKNDKKSDYILNDTVDLKKDQIMRLNPDLLSYTRNVNILPSEQNTDVIAFEITEIEKDSLALNLIVQNGFLFSNMNIIYDKGKWFISKEKIIGKELNNKFLLNVFKYEKNGKNTYVFCFNTDYPELDQNYGFEIEGILIGGYNFNTTGLLVENHSDYFKYEPIDSTNNKPIYNETYYVKSKEMYEVLVNGEKVQEEREIYIPYTKLINFEEGKEYYIREKQFSFIKSFDIIHGASDGIVDIEDNISDNDNQVVVDNTSYSGNIKALKLDYEVSEVFDDNEDADTNDYIFNRKKLAEDDSVRMFNNGESFVSVGKSPKKIDNRVSAAYGEEAFDVVDLRPCEIVNTNSYLNRNASDHVYKAIHGNLEKSGDTDYVTEIALNIDNFDKNRLISFNNGNAAYIDEKGCVYFKNNGWEKNNVIENEIFTWNQDEHVETDGTITTGHTKLGNVKIEAYNDNYILVTAEQVRDNFAYRRKVHVNIYANAQQQVWVEDKEFEKDDAFVKINCGKMKREWIITSTGEIFIPFKRPSGYDRSVMVAYDLNQCSYILTKDDYLIRVATSHTDRDREINDPLSLKHITGEYRLFNANDDNAISNGNIINNKYIFCNVCNLKNGTAFFNRADGRISSSINYENNYSNDTNNFPKFRLNYDNNEIIIRPIYYMDPPVVGLSDILDSNGMLLESTGIDIKEIHFNFKGSFNTGFNTGRQNLIANYNSDFTTITNIEQSPNLWTNDHYSNIAKCGNLSIQLRSGSTEPSIDYDRVIHFVFDGYTNNTIVINKNFIDTHNFRIGDFGPLFNALDNKTVKIIKDKTSEKYYVYIENTSYMYTIEKNGENAPTIRVSVLQTIKAVKGQLGEKLYFINENDGLYYFDTNNLVTSKKVENTSDGEQIVDVVFTKDNLGVYFISRDNYLCSFKDEATDVLELVDQSVTNPGTDPSIFYIQIPDSNPVDYRQATADDFTTDSTNLVYKPGVNYYMYVKHTQRVLSKFLHLNNTNVKFLNWMIDSPIKQETVAAIDNKLYYIKTNLVSPLYTEASQIQDIASTQNINLVYKNDDPNKFIVYYEENNSSKAKIVNRIESVDGDVSFDVQSIVIPLVNKFTPLIKDNSLYMYLNKSLFIYDYETRKFDNIIKNKIISDVISFNEDEKHYFLTPTGLLTEFVYDYKSNIDFYSLKPEHNPYMYQGDKIYVKDGEIFRSDIYDDESLVNEIVHSNDPILSKRIEIINDYIKRNLVFINSYKIGIISRSENTVDIIIIPDEADIANGDFYMLFTLNISTDLFDSNAIEKVLVYRGLTKNEGEFINKKTLWQEKWTSITSNDKITVAIGKNGLFYSYNGDVFHRLSNPLTVNTHEAIDFDDSWEVNYGSNKFFYATRVDKTSTDHTMYVSDNGLRWSKLDIDILIPELTGQAFYPKIYSAGLNKTWFICKGFGRTVMLDNPGIKYLISKYTDYYIHKEVEPFGPDYQHLFELPFQCSDLVWTGEYYYALDITNERFVYATLNATTSIREYIVQWNPITIQDQLFTNPRIYDFGIYGHDLRGAIIYGSGLNDPSTAGVWYAPYDAPDSFTKSTDISVGVRNFYPCAAIYKEQNGIEIAKDYIYLKGSDGKTYVSENFGKNWVEEIGTNEVMFIGSYNNYFILKNTDNGLVCGKTLAGLPNIESDFTSKMNNPHACMSRSFINTFGYNVYHITDDTTGKILFSTDLEHWYPVSVIGYNPIVKLNDSGDRVVGETSLYPIAINKDYDESYCPTKDTYLHNLKTLNEKNIYISIDNNGLIVLHIDDKEHTIPNSEGIDPSNFLIFALDNGKIRYCFCSEINKGLWFTEQTGIGELPTGTLIHVSLDIYVENGFQTSDGVFVYGQDADNKTKLYFMSSQNINDSNFVFDEKLSVDYIDYIKPHNDDIIISTYDRTNEYDKYTYNKETKNFEKYTAIDMSDVFSFDNTFEYKDDIYFVNGSGSNNNIRSNDFNNEGIFRIRKFINSNGKIQHDIYPIIRSDKLYKNISSSYGKIYTGILQIDNDKYLIVISGKDDTNSTFVTNKFILNMSTLNDEERLIEIDSNDIESRYNNPLLYDINNIINTEKEHAMVVVEQDRRGSPVNIPSYGLVVQRHSFQCNINKLTDSNISLLNKIDEFYFDKENKTIKFNTYGVSGTQDFKLNSEKIAYNFTINDNKQGLIIALGQDNAFGVFDKTLDHIKVLNAGYIDRTTGKEIYTKLDTNYNILQSVIIGANNNRLKVYGLFYGKFPKYTRDIDSNEYYLDYNNAITIYKVFSIDYDDLKNSTDDAVLIEETGFSYDESRNIVRNELKTFIKSQKYEPSSDLNLTDTEVQFIATRSGILYDNTYSLLAWNSKRRCIEVYTKFRYDSSLKNPNETSNINQKTSSSIEGDDFERDSLYVNSGLDITSNKLKYFKFNNESDGYIETKPFVCNLTNRKNLLFSDIDDYKRDILFDSSRYIKYMQTRFGVFRYLNEDQLIAVNKTIGTNFVYNERDLNKVEGIPKTYRSFEGNILFTPEGSNDVMVITLCNGGTVVNIWETYNTVFIQTKETEMYVYDEQEVYKLYRMDLIPDSNLVEVISIKDTRYFTEMDTYYSKIYDLLDTPEGLICVATEPKGITDTTNQNIDTNIYTGKSYVFWYNGDDFIIVKSWDHNDPDTWVKFTNIIQTKDEPLLIDPRKKEVWTFSESSFTVTKLNTTIAQEFLDSLSNYEYAHKYNPNYPLPVVDYFSEDNIIYNFYLNNAGSDNEKYSLKKFKIGTDKSISLIDSGSNNIHSSQNSVVSLTRYPIIRPSDTSRNYNHDFIQNILSKNIPLNKNLKAFGSMVCDGVRFSVSGMKVETHPGENNRVFKTLIFNIDKYYRSDLSKEIFTEDPGVIKFGFGNIERNIQKLNMILLY